MPRIDKALIPNVVATQGLASSLLTRSNEGERKSTLDTRNFHGPAHERRRGRTNAPIFFLYSQATWCSTPILPTSSTGDGYIDRARSARTPRSTPAHQLAHARTNLPPCPATNPTNLATCRRTYAAQAICPQWPQDLVRQLRTTRPHAHPSRLVLTFFPLILTRLVVDRRIAPLRRAAPSVCHDRHALSSRPCRALTQATRPLEQLDLLPPRRPSPRSTRPSSYPRRAPTRSTRPIQRVQELGLLLAEPHRATAASAPPRRSAAAAALSHARHHRAPLHGLG